MESRDAWERQRDSSSGMYGRYGDNVPMCPGVVKLRLRDKCVRWVKCGSTAARDCSEGMEMSQLSRTREESIGALRRSWGMREETALWGLMGGPCGLERL
jgi:hypothetical protein